MALNIGTKAPNFLLPSTKGDFNLYSDFKEQSCIVYFYPKDFTTVCTKEACSFKDEFSVFKEFNIPIVGISRDNVETHLRFKKQYELPFELCADIDGKVAKEYKAIVPVVGLTKRVTYLLDKDKTIKAVFSDFFGSENHVQEMISKIR